MNSAATPCNVCKDGSLVLSSSLNQFRRDALNIAIDSGIARGSHAHTFTLFDLLYLIQHGCTTWNEYRSTYPLPGTRDNPCTE